MQARYNQDTQPLPRYRLFNNWEAVSKGWFVLCRSDRLRPGQARSFVVCGHKVVAYRGRSGEAHAMDAFCPHMGLDLGQGEVLGEDLRCAFHHWVFDGEGRRRGGPPATGEDPAPCLQGYRTWEGYGVLWIYPDRHSEAPPYLPPELEGKPVRGSPMRPQVRTCHPHAATSNGVDIHHVRAVHHLDMEIEYTVAELQENVIRFDFTGHLTGGTWGGRLARLVLGPAYGYSITYVDGTLGIFHSLRGVKLLGRFPAPEAFMILAPRWTEVGQVEVHPIALAEDRPGLWGRLRSWCLLGLAKVIYSLVVAGEGTEFFRHLRYRVDNLEPEKDDPVATLVQFFDRQQISMWSRSQGERPC